MAMLLAQGVCIGVGCGALAVLSVAIPSLWFINRLPIANGIAGIGSGLGGYVGCCNTRREKPSEKLRDYYCSFTDYLYRATASFSPLWYGTCCLGSALDGLSGAWRLCTSCCWV